MLKKTIERLVLGLLVAGVAAAAVYFGLRLYFVPHQQQLLSRTQELQVLAQNLRSGVESVGGGDFTALPAIKRDADRIAAIIARLQQHYASSSPVVTVLMPPGEAPRWLAEWDDMHDHIQVLAANERVLGDVQHAFSDLDTSTDAIQSRLQALAQLLVDRGTSAREIYLASRQQLLIQRISRHLHRVLHPPQGSTVAEEKADYAAIINDSTAFERTLGGMLNGDKDLGLAPVTGADAEQKLHEIADLFDSVNGDMGTILGAAPALLKVQHAAAELLAASGDLIRGAGALSQSLVNREQRHNALFIALYLGATAMLLVMFVYCLYLYRAFEGQLGFSTTQNARYRQIVRRVRDTVERLAKGQLPAGAMESREGLESVTVPLNEVIAHWRETVETVKNRSGELRPLTNAAATAAAGIDSANREQVENTAKSSATVNRLVPAVEELSRQVAVVAQEIDALKSQCAAARALITRADAPHGADAARRDVVEGRFNTLAEQVLSLTKGIEQLSAIVLHLIIRAHGHGQPGDEPLPYANKALQVAHQCTEAVDALGRTLNEFRGETGRVLGHGGRPEEAVPVPGDAVREVEKTLQAADALTTRIAGLLGDMLPTLNEQRSRILSLSDDLDRIHEYTMQSSNATAEVARSIKRIVESIDHIRKCVDKYNIVR